jgi:hypothetical protein
MSKKMMLLALAVASMAMFALPAVASAQEDHVDGITVFNGAGGAVTLSASGEPTITCEFSHVEGSVNSGGTTGFINFAFTGCHVNVIFTIPCHSPSGLVNNEITWNNGSFHIITINNKPGIMVTPGLIVIECAGISTVMVSGNGVIGTITSPACNVESKEMTVAFSATGTTQNHIAYTGVNYDLNAQTSGGSALTAGLTNTLTVSGASKGKVTCT